jgi:benzoylsuccinyl-CoA thiolase BbsA subunit
MEGKTIFHAGTLEEMDGRLVQVGHKCKACGKVNFPQSERCMFCGSNEFEKVPLSEEGILYSYAVTEVPVGPYKPPIIGGFIDLPEGARVYAQIRTDREKVKKGMKVKVQVAPIYTQEDGTEVMGYYYVPAEENEGGAK